MGNINAKARSYFGWERWLLGWLDDSQVTCINSKQTISVPLSAIETPDTVNPKKIIVVPIIGSNKKQVLVVEVRRTLGDDIISKEGYFC